MDIDKIVSGRAYYDACYEKLVKIVTDRRDVHYKNREKLEFKALQNVLNDIYIQQQQATEVDTSMLLIDSKSIMFRKQAD